MIFHPPSPPPLPGTPPTLANRAIRVCDLRHIRERTDPVTLGQRDRFMTALSCHPTIPSRSRIYLATHEGVGHERSGRCDRHAGQARAAPRPCRRHRRGATRRRPPARAPARPRLAARAPAGLGSGGADRLHRRAVLPGALHHHRRADRAHALGRARRPCADQPAADRARFRARRDSRRDHRHRHGHCGGRCAR